MRLFSWVDWHTASLPTLSQQSARYASISLPVCVCPSVCLCLPVCLPVHGAQMCVLTLLSHSAVTYLDWCNWWPSICCWDCHAASAIPCVPHPSVCCDMCASKDVICVKTTISTRFMALTGQYIRTQIETGLMDTKVLGVWVGVGCGCGCGCGCSYMLCLCRTLWLGCRVMAWWCCCSLRTWLLIAKFVICVIGIYSSFSSLILFFSLSLFRLVARLLLCMFLLISLTNTVIMLN